MNEPASVSLTPTELYLRSIALSLETLCFDVKAPALRRQYKDYVGFDWASIGAIVIGKHGAYVIEVEWNHHRYVARRGDEKSKFGKAIWFSRGQAGEGDADKSWERLITFKDYFTPSRG
jgi:hypothetical protein